MHPFHIYAAVLTLSIMPARSESAAWRTGFPEARAEAKESGKVLLLDFTGSDWCSWCIHLHKEVFDKQEFLAAAPEKFVLVELDYPKDNSKFPKSLVKQNETLLKRYPVTGYPTVLLCDSDARPFAATGYQEGGVTKYLAHLDELAAKRKTRDDALAAASGMEGVAKSRALIKMLDDLGLPDGMIRIHYGEVIDQIKAADPADDTGYASQQADEIRLADFLTQLGEFRSQQDLDGALKLIERTLADPKVKGDLRQQVHGHHAGSLAYANRDDEAIAVLKEAVAEAPEGTRTKELDEFIQILERKKADQPLQPPAVSDK